MVFEKQKCRTACTVVRMPTCLYGYSNACLPLRFLNAFLPVWLVKYPPVCGFVRGAEVRGRTL